MREFGPAAITDAINNADGPAVCAYITAGYPNREVFGEVLQSVATAADVVEVGVPFTDPMADGHTIQRSSAIALEKGVTLAWILEMLEDESRSLAAPYLLMGYYNPFLAFRARPPGRPSGSVRRVGGHRS